MSEQVSWSRDRTMRVRVAQIDCALGDIAGNLARAGAVLEQARDERSDLVVFPELSLTGYSIAQVGEDVSLQAIDETFSPLLGPNGSLSAVVGFAEAGRLHTYNSAAYLRGPDL